MLFDSPHASIPYFNLLCIRAKYRDFIALWGRICLALFRTNVHFDIDEQIY